jgi:hypothetical protein
MSDSLIVSYSVSSIINRLIISDHLVLLVIKSNESCLNI